MKTILEQENKKDKNQQCMKHLEGVKKDRKSDDNTCMEMAETKANIEERILEFIEKFS